MFSYLTALNGGAFFHTLVAASDADYIVWCDADDTYSPDFLEKTVAFAKKNQLDITACGYESIDEETGRILKHRAVEKDLIIEKDLFTKEFIQYRGFTCHIWGKLYSLRFFKSKNYTGIKERQRNYGDSIWVLDLFWEAKKVGIVQGALYQWYQHPNSLTHANWIDSLKQTPNYWLATKAYIERYGKISKLNKDFLYAIYLSLAEEAIGNVFLSELNTQKKLKLLKKVFSNPIWTDTLNRKADPIFHNLANRKEFISSIKKQVLALPGIDEYPMETKRLFLYFNTDLFQNEGNDKTFDELYQAIESATIKNKPKSLFDNLSKKIANEDNYRLILYGAGGNCEFAMYNCTQCGFTVDFVCDTKATGTYTYGGKTYEIISSDVLMKNHQDAFVLITPWQYEQEIYDFLCDSGFPSTQIYFFHDFPGATISPTLFREKYLEGYQKAYSLFHDGGSKNRILDRVRLLLEGVPCPEDSPHENGYFCFPGINITEKEIYVDGGANIGDTAEEFIDLMGGTNEDYKIYSFEPDPQSYEAATKNLSQYSNVEVFPYALSSHKTELKFANAQGVDGVSSHITTSDTNSITVQATSLDLFFADKPQDEWPTIIKLDIEGAEKEALLGAENIIKAKKPQLIICAYHKPEDMYELPQAILKLRDDYKLTFWQIGTSFWDMILYAV